MAKKYMRARDRYTVDAMHGLSNAEIARKHGVSKQAVHRAIGQDAKLKLWRLFWEFVSRLERQ